MFSSAAIVASLLSVLFPLGARFGVYSREGRTFSLTANQAIAAVQWQVQHMTGIELSVTDTVAAVSAKRLRGLAVMDSGGISYANSVTFTPSQRKQLCAVLVVVSALIMFPGCLVSLQSSSHEHCVARTSSVRTMRRPPLAQRRGSTRGRSTVIP